MPNPIGPKLQSNSDPGLPQEVPQDVQLTAGQQALSELILQAAQGQASSAATAPSTPVAPATDTAADTGLLRSRALMLQALQTGGGNGMAAAADLPPPPQQGPPVYAPVSGAANSAASTAATSAPSDSLSAHNLLRQALGDLNVPGDLSAAGAPYMGTTTDPDLLAAQEQLAKSRELLAPVEEDLTQFDQQAEEARNTALQDVPTNADDPTTATAKKGSIWGGIINAHENEIWSYTNDQLAERYLWHSDDPFNQSKIRWGINPYATLFLQNGFNIPGTKNKPTDEEHQLFAPGGGPLINAATGEPVKVPGLVPERTYLARFNLVGGVEGYFASQYELPWVREHIPFLGALLANLSQPTVRAQFELIGRYDLGDSSNGPYDIKNTGAIINPDGTVSSTGDIDPTFNKLGLDYHFYARASFPSTIIRIPGLTYGYEQLTGVDLYEKKEDAGVMDELFKFVGEAFFAPKIAPYFSFERRPDVDQDHDTLLDPPQINYKAGLLWLNTGLGIEWGKEKDTTKLNWKEVDTRRIFWAMPLKIPFTMLGWEDVLADTFEVDGFEPLANPDTLLWDSSKFVIYTETKDYHGSSSPLLGEAFDGSVGPGGPGGKNVTGHSTGFGAALEIRFQETPFENGVLNTVFGNSRWVVGTQIMDLEIKGNDLPLEIPLGGVGSVGTITTEAPAALLPSPEGRWWSVSLDYEKIVPLGVNSNLRLGAYLDQRKILGDVTNNSVSDKPITTLGFQVGFTPGKSFSKGATNI